MEEEQVSSPSVHEFRAGVIKLDHRLAQEIFSDLTIDSTNTQGALRDKGVFDTIHHQLLLPDTYKVIGIQFDMLRRLWYIGVESDELPIVPENSDAPEIILHYDQNRDNLIRLSYIEVTSFYHVHHVPQSEYMSHPNYELLKLVKENSLVYASNPD